MPQQDRINEGFPYESRYVAVHGSQMHYVERGQGHPILFLHGNPTSSYLWRNIIPYVEAQGRCIAVDLIGMGKSDKPDIDYRFVDHVRYLDGFIEALDLRYPALVVHDWGSALGFHYARRHPWNVRGIAFMEAIIRPVDSWDDFPESARKLFQTFRTPDVGWELIRDKNVFVERVLPGSILRKLSENEMNHYREPFAEPESRKPTWRWPNEIPIEGEPADVAEIVAEYCEYLQTTHLPKMLIYAEPGVLVSESLVAWCKEHLPACSTFSCGSGSHFIQEDQPEMIGRGLCGFVEALNRAFPIPFPAP